jgi:hypothetical protein
MVHVDRGIAVPSSPVAALDRRQSGPDVLHAHRREFDVRILQGYVDPNEQHLGTPSEHGGEWAGQRVGAEQLVTSRAQHEASVLQRADHRGLGRRVSLQSGLEAEDGCLQRGEVVRKGWSEALDQAGPRVIGMSPEPVR